MPDRFNLAFIDEESLTLTNNMQGVAFDGTHYYASTSTHLYKFTRDAGTGAYTEVASRDVSGEYPTSGGGEQINSLHYRASDGYLWVGGHSAAASLSYIQVYDPSDLSLVDSHDIGEGKAEGGAWKNLGDGDAFWVVYQDEPKVARFEINGSGDLEHVADYPLSLREGETDNNYQGAVWFGNVIIVQSHNNGVPQVHYYEWNGSGFTANHATMPIYGQGLHWEGAAEDGGVMLFARRVGDKSISRWTFREMPSAGSFTPYGDAVRADDPVVYWPMLDIAGDSLAELAHINRPGRIDGAVGFGGEAFTNDSDAASFDFDSSEGAAAGLLKTDQQRTLLSGLSAITIEAWFEVDASIDRRCIASKTVDGANNGEWFLTLFDNNTIQFGTTSSDTNTNSTMSVTYAMTTGVKYHIVATWDGTTKRVYIAPKGEEITEVDNAAWSATSLRSVNASGCHFGRLGEAFRPFDGLLGEGAIYDTALSLTRIQAHHTAADEEPGGGIPPLMSHYRQLRSA